MKKKNAQRYLFQDCGRASHMVPRSAATAAAHRFATAAIPAAVDVLRARPGQGTRPVPFYSLQSPVRAALKEVLATLHDVAHGVPTDHPASRGSGICIVGNKGTGTSTVLATAAAAVRALLPQYGTAAAGQLGRQTTLTCRNSATGGSCASFRTRTWPSAQSTVSASYSWP